MLPEEILLVEPGQLTLLPQVTPPLLDWYRQNARSLPWRDEPTPYRVWVSEIMLQQTRVEAVRGYFQRFMEALPDIPALAAAPEDQLLKLWEGLGYYNRVRNLQKAARVVMASHGGRLPASYGELLGLPGIGPYTAGAIASIAFGISVPAVDGNVLRVLSRITGCYADIAQPKVRQAWERVIPHMQPESAPGNFNQAMMELGATVCLPNGPPLCTACPASGLCEAFEKSLADELPVKAAKKARQVEERTVVLIVSRGEVLLFRRQETLLGGMFEPLNLEGHLSPVQIEEAVASLGGKVEKQVSMRDSKHLFTHREWHMKGMLVYAPPFPPPGGAVWSDRHQLREAYALPSAFRAYTKLLPELLADSEQRV